MKRTGLWIKLALLLCVAVTVVFAPSSSLAYITANSNTLRNSFRVVYLPPQDISVPLTIHKTMVNLSSREIGPGGFEFQLLNVNTQETVSAISSGDGLAVIHLPFTAEDVGRIQHYRLYEVNTGLENVTYDDTVYTISLTPVLNEAHELTVEMTMNGVPVSQIVAKFENKYCVPIPLPDTGDHARLALWLAMLVGSGAGLIVMRRKLSSGGCK